MARKKSNKQSGSNGATLGFDKTLWLAADKLRNNMDAAEYKHVVLGLIFLKYISDAFEEKYERLEAERDQGADPEDPDEYRAEGRHLLGAGRDPRGDSVCRLDEREALRENN